MSPWINLDPCPDSVWEVLPGGRDARGLRPDETWEYMGTSVVDRWVTHHFRHPRHMEHGGRSVWATVRDGDLGPHLLTYLVKHGDFVEFDELGNEVYRG